MKATLPKRKTPETIPRLLSGICETDAGAIVHDAGIGSGICSDILNCGCREFRM